VTPSNDKLSIVGAPNTLENRLWDKPKEKEGLDKPAMPFMKSFGSERKSNNDYLTYLTGSRSCEIG